MGLFYVPDGGQAPNGDTRKQYLLFPAIIIELECKCILLISIIM